MLYDGIMTELVGILNVTPDSFSDGGLYMETEKALQKTAQLFKEGAAVVDVGAESTRPGATVLTTEAEQQRLLQILQQLIEQYPGKISVDTYHPETARRALELGDVIINDVTGMHDSAMLELVSARRARCVVSHLPAAAAGDPQAAHAGPLVDDVRQVREELLAKAAELQRQGLPRDRIILDPGIGFGKTEHLNKELLTFAREVPEYSVMIGYSRKRFLGARRLEPGPNLEAGRIALEAGAAYLRVHDVAGHSRLLRRPG